MSQPIKVDVIIVVGPRNLTSMVKIRSGHVVAVFLIVVVFFVIVVGDPRFLSSFVRIGPEMIV